jgi:replicative DNA helicase
MVVVDYIQLIDGERSRGASRESEVSEICRRLTALAGELNVALVALSQLTREVEKRPNKRPQLSDLRESGAIEQDAYSVSFLYRDEYYHESANAGVLEWILAKHRNGPLGTVWLKWDGECVRIDELCSEPDGFEDFDEWRHR